MVAAVAAVAALAHWMWVRPLGAAGVGDDNAWLVAVTLGFLAAELGVVHLRLGRDAYAFSMMEIPLVIGLFFIRPDLLVLCRLAGALLAFVVRRKDVQKAAFNLALFSLETTGAVLIWHRVVGDRDPLGPWGWAATVLAVLFTSVVSSTLVSAAITLASGARPRSLREVFSLGQLGDLANACFAMVAAYVLTHDWRGVWLLAVVLGVLVVAYQSYERARARSDSLEQVNRFTELIGRDVDVDAVVRSVLVEVAAALEVERAHLRLTRPLEDARDWIYQEQVVAPQRSALVDGLVEHADGGAVVASRQQRSGTAALARELGVREAVMVPLRSVGEVAGFLVVADRMSAVAPFTRTDVRQLQALANHAAVALENAVRAEMIIHQVEEREHEALHDELTGLANRRLLTHALERRLTRASAALMLLDLDRFKDVNDTLGHEAGDRLLQTVAQRITEATPDGSLVARLGGDEFAVLLPLTVAQDPRECAVMLREALARPLVLGASSVAVDASVGLATADKGESAASVLRWADLAMYAAKEARTGLEAYRPALERYDSSRLGLLADLREAVSLNRLDVAYQPKIDVGTGRVVGAEALARWRHPLVGDVRPDEFIPLAEHGTLITPLTMLVLRRALREAERWRARIPDFSVAVNISPRSLLDPTFVDQVARALAMVGLPSSALTLEITETSLMSDPERAIAALERLREIGLKLSVDDLGTGYSSLAYLQRLPVDEVKIDRSFLAEFTQPSAQAVVGTIVELGHRLGKSVVAEGVEVSESFEALRTLGCDCAQGYWIAKPMPADDFSRFLGDEPPRAVGALRLVH